MANEVQKTQSGTPSGLPRDPFQTFREEINSLFDRALSRPFGFFDLPSLPSLGGALVMPKIDIHEGEKDVTLTAELPGVDEKDVELLVRDGVLTLRGEKRYEKKEGEGDARVVERHYGSFERRFTLPSDVDEEKISATFDKGVLKIVLPRAPGAHPNARRISISKG